MSDGGCRETCVWEGVVSWEQCSGFDFGLCTVNGWCRRTCHRAGFLFRTACEQWAADGQSSLLAVHVGTGRPRPGRRRALPRTTYGPASVRRRACPPPARPPPFVPPRCSKRFRTSHTVIPKSSKALQPFQRAAIASARANRPEAFVLRPPTPPIRSDYHPLCR